MVVSSNLSTKKEKITKIDEMKEKEKIEIPFSWGKFTIFVGFFQGSIAFIFGGIFGIKTEYLPNRIYAIILGLILLSYAFGLMQKKRWEAKFLTTLKIKYLYIRIVEVRDWIFLILIL